MDNSAQNQNTIGNNTQNLTPPPVNSSGAAASPPKPPITPAIPSVSIASPPAIPKTNLINPPNQNPDISAKPPQTPNLPPLPTTNVNQSPIPPEKPVKRSINFLNLLLLIGGPLFMVGSILFVFYRLGANQPETYLQGAGKTKTVAEITNVSGFQKTLANVPKNPDQVNAVCQSTGEKIVSGTSTDCPDPVFEWSGAGPREPETKIIGYYVYFGPNNNDSPIFTDSPANLIDQVINPKRDGTFQQSNIFTPQNLVEGQTYYLAVNSVSDSQNKDWKMGLDIVDEKNLTTRSGKIIFIYDYR